MGMGQNPLQMEVMISESKIRDRVKEMANQISSDLHGQELIVIGVLKGSFIFLADLVRELDVPLQIEFIGVASYEGTQSTGHVQLTRDLSADIAGKHVLIVEDIIDTGKTMDYLLDLFRVREPRSIKVCSLLSKPEAHEMRHNIDYVGFEISNEFVVGYGLDLDGRYRELPYVGKINS